MIPHSTRSEDERELGARGRRPRGDRTRRHPAARACVRAVGQRLRRPPAGADAAGGVRRRARRRSGHAGVAAEKALEL